MKRRCADIKEERKRMPMGRCEEKRKEWARH